MTKDQENRSARESTISKVLTRASALMVFGFITLYIGTDIFAREKPHPELYFAVSGADTQNRFHSIYLDTHTGLSIDMRQNSPWWLETELYASPTIFVTKHEGTIRVQFAHDPSKRIDIPVEPESIMQSYSLSEDKQKVVILSTNRMANTNAKDFITVGELIFVDIPTESITRIDVPTSTQLSSFTSTPDLSAALLVGESAPESSIYSCSSDGCTVISIPQSSNYCLKTEMQKEDLYALCATATSSAIFVLKDERWQQVSSDPRFIYDFKLSPDGKYVGYDVVVDQQTMAAVSLDLNTKTIAETSAKIFMPMYLSWESDIKAERG